MGIIFHHAKGDGFDMAQFATRAARSFVHEPFSSTSGVETEKIIGFNNYAEIHFLLGYWVEVLLIFCRKSKGQNIRNLDKK